MALISNDVLSINYMNMDMCYDVWKNSLDEDNKKFVPDEVFETLDEAKEVVAQIIQSYQSESGPFVYAVTRNSDEANLGYVQLVKIKEGWEIGYHIAKKYTGNGYATTAVKLFLEHLKNGGYKQIYGVALASNKASRRVLEKTGFKLFFEGYGTYQGRKRKIIRTLINL